MRDLLTSGFVVEVVLVALLTAVVVLAVLGRIGVRRLAASERRLRSTFTSSPAGLAFLDVEGRVLEANPALARLLGRSTDELRGDALPAAPGSADAALLSALVGEAALRNGEAALRSVERRAGPDGELRLRRGDGEVVVVSLTLTPIERARRAPVVLAQLLDVTDRRREGDTRLRLALDAVSMGLWEWDLRGGAVTWSDGAARLLGVDPALPPTEELALGAVAPDDREPLRSALREALRSDEPLELEFRVDLPEGGRWLLSRAQVQRGRDGRAERVLGVLLDVSSRRALEEERASRSERAARAMERALQVQDVASDLAQALTVADVIATLADQVFPVVGADGLLLSLVHSGDGRLRLVRSAGYEEGFRDLVGELDVADAHPMAQVLRQGQPMFLPTPEDYLRRFPHLRTTVEQSGKAAWAVLPLVVPGRRVGTWLLSWTTPHAFSGDDRALFTTLAGLAAQALERAHLFEGQREIATGLQTALLPARLPELAGTDVLARYLAGGDGMVVGGDFYDVLVSGGSAAGVLLGDVMGRGVPAAGVMGAVRHTLRAYGAEGHPPGQVLERANQMLATGDGDQFATCCYAEYDTTAGTLVLANAGHPPPLLVPAEGPARLLEVDGGLPLALFPGSTYPETTIVLEPGDTVLLYTDGLVERSGASIDDGLDALVAAADDARPRGPRAGEPLALLLGRLLEALLPAVGTDDDVAVLALRRRPLAGDEDAAPSVVRRFPDMPTSPGAARRFTSDVLAQWGLGPLVETAALLVTEVVTNAVAHTVGDVELTLRREPERLVVEAVDTDERHPEVLEPDEESQSGRGMWLVATLASGWGVEPLPTGKRVWFALDA